MKIVPIFVKGNKREGLFSIRFTNEVETELEKCMTQWLDTEYLYDFFTKHESDLNNGYYDDYISISQAISHTREEAYRLFQRISELAVSDTTQKRRLLSNAFQPLTDGDFSQKFLQNEKAKTKVNLRCLRIYAIKISNTTFIITGSAIKLTRTMGKRKHLKAELQKKDKVRAFLIKQGILNQTDFNSFKI